jgi:hypothetical protein
MSEDIERLFRNINQAGVPYHVFEPPTVPSPAIGKAEPELIVSEQATWAIEVPPSAPPESIAPAKSGVFRKYVADEKAEPAAGLGAGTPLQPIFDRLREKYAAAKG